MIKLLLPLVCAFSVLLSGCGGDGGPTTPPDTAAPLLNSLTSAKTAAAEFTMTATGTDNVGLVGYCFKITSAAPLASDACFQASNQKKIALTVPLPAVYVWGKDAAGNVSANPLVGPCSAAGYLASGTSTLPTVCMMTTLGELVVALENVKAPATTTNFLLYVNEGFYSDTVFHRVISNFVVQGGGFNHSAATNQYTAKAVTRAPILLEAPATTGLSNTLGTIAMARTGELNSATSQFYINVTNNINLDFAGGGYAVFGRLISGTATLDAIKAVAVVSNGSEVSLPTTPPVIQWAAQLK